MTFSLNATDDESIKVLFTPVCSLGEDTDYTDYEYDLRKAHQRANVAMDKHLGYNNVQAGIDNLGPLKYDGYIEAVSWAACFVIRASLTLEKVSSLFTFQTFQTLLFSFIFFRLTGKDGGSERGTQKNFMIEKNEFHS